MAGDKGSGKKGFAGLESMVSEVEVPKAPPPAPVRKEEKGAQLERTPRQPAPAYATPNPSSSKSPWLGFLKIVGGLLFFSWLVSAAMRDPSPPPPAMAPAPEAPAPAPEAPAPAPAPYYQPAMSAQTYEPPASAAASNSEEKPPEGSGLVFNDSQMRYCLSEKIRMSGWESHVNQYSETSVNAFNEAVNDYNMRCSHFRYRSGTLESTRSEVEANRYALTQQGEASAAANP